MSRTKKDLRKFDVKRNKELSRKQFMDINMKTRVKPIEKKEKGGGQNWRNKINPFSE